MIVYKRIEGSFCRSSPTFYENYCTGTGIEFYTQPEPQYNKPLDETGHPYKENGFGTTWKFHSFYVYAKPLDPSFNHEPGVGFKFMPFPDLDMVPEDQTTCVPDTTGNRHVGNDGPGSKFLYFEFINEDKGWPDSTAYHCLINQPV